MSEQVNKLTSNGLTGKFVMNKRYLLTRFSFGNVWLINCNLST